jgi:hypothetical protein
MVERQPLKSTTDKGAQPSLEQKIASALRSDGSMASADLQQLIGEVETAAAAAAQSVEQARVTALDPLNLDSARAFEAGHLAQLSCDRLRHALQLLQRQLAAALGAAMSRSCSAIWWIRPAYPRNSTPKNGATWSALTWTPPQRR